MDNNIQVKSSTYGTMISGALVFGALFILIWVEQHFSITFTLDALPNWARVKIESQYDGILITATKISKSGGGDFESYSKGVADSILANLVYPRTTDALSPTELKQEQTKDYGK